MPCRSPEAKGLTEASWRRHRVTWAGARGRPLSFRFIDLFAGVGGLRMPFDELGGECVFTSEIDRNAQKTYLWNYGELPSGDITKIAAADIPEFDVLLAGFPCQPFSNAGLRKGFADTRGTLFYDIERIIEHHQPKIVVLENVKGLRNHDQGRTLTAIREILSEKLGYSLTNPVVVNSVDFGVPQRRERLVIIATKNVAAFEFPAIKPKFKHLSEILEDSDVVDPKYGISERLWSSHQERKERNKLNGKGFGYSLVDANSTSTRTLSARYYKDGSEILIARPNKTPRKLTPREALRLQGFPENFRIAVSDNQVYKQMGNSVSVPVFRFVASALVPLIDPGATKSRWTPVPVRDVQQVISGLSPSDKKFFSK